MTEVPGRMPVRIKPNAAKMPAMISAIRLPARLEIRAPSNPPIQKKLIAMVKLRASSETPHPNSLLNGVFKMEAIAETLLNRLVEESNSEELFVKGYLKSCPGNNLAASRVFDAYKAFCRENGFSAKSSHCLYQAILLAYGSAGEKKKVRDPYVLANSSVQGFCGLALEGGETDGN